MSYLIILDRVRCQKGCKVSSWAISCSHMDRVILFLLGIWKFWKISIIYFIIYTPYHYRGWGRVGCCQWQSARLGSLGHDFASDQHSS